MSSIHLLLSLTVIPRQCMRSEARPASRDAWFSGKPDCTDHAISSASSVGYRVHISPHVCVHPRMCAQCRRAGACFADASAIGARAICIRFYTIDAECIEDHDTPRESRRKSPIPDHYRSYWTSGLCARLPQAVDVTRLYSPLHFTPAVASLCTPQPAPAHLFPRSWRTYPRLVEHHGGALPGHAVLPVVVSGIHGRAAEHAGDGAGGVGAVVSDATPGRRGAHVARVVVGQEGLNAHKLLEVHSVHARTHGNS